MNRIDRQIVRELLTLLRQPQHRVPPSLVEEESQFGQFRIGCEHPRKSIDIGFFHGELDAGRDLCSQRVERRQLPFELLKQFVGRVRRRVASGERGEIAGQHFDRRVLRQQSLPSCHR